MSVVVSDANDKLWLFAKGAEVTMMPLMISGHKEETARHFNDFSMVSTVFLMIMSKNVQ